MTPSTTSLYRQVAAEGATYIGLLTVVLDSLAEDLRLAGLAATRRDIPARCSASNHAFLLLGHLESWAVEMDEPSLKTSLLSFYSYIRATLLELQLGASEQRFFELVTHVTLLRATWQQKEKAFLQSSRQIQEDGFSKLKVQELTRSPTTWSA